MDLDFVFAPELRLLDGSIIRDRDDALSFLRAQEVRPGVDRRGELLHVMERADSPAEVEAATARFRAWLGELQILDERS